PPDRLQVICTSASFKDPEYAARFGEKLTGKAQGSFETIQADPLYREGASPGDEEDARSLAEIDLARFYESTTDEARLESVRPFLQYRGVEPREGLHRSLFEALVDFPPMALLINSSMMEAQPVEELGPMLFKEA